MLKRIFRIAGVTLATAFALTLFAPAAQAQTEQQKLIADAEKVLPISSVIRTWAGFRTTLAARKRS